MAEDVSSSSLRQMKGSWGGGGGRQCIHKRSSQSLGDVLMGLGQLCPSVCNSVLSDADLLSVRTLMTSLYVGD